MKKVLIPTVCMVAVFLGACAKKEEKQIMPATPAQFAQAITKDVPAYISTLGTTSSLHSVSIVPQVSGQITEIKFNQGDSVKKGQILAVIDKRPYEAEVKRTEGALKQAIAQLEIDKLQVERNEKLAKEKYVDQMTFDTLKAKVDVDQGVVESAKAALDNAKINLGWCDIVSPIDGKVGLYNINAGNVVAAGSSVITTVEQVDDLYVDFIVPSQRLYDVQNFMKTRDGKLSVKVSYIEDNLSAERSREATVDIVLNKIRYDSGTAVLRGKIANNDHLFWPDQPVKVLVNLEDIKGAVLVPNVCVQTNDVGPYVYIAQPYKGGVYIVKQVQVEKGQLYDGEMRIIKGVEAGTFVVERVSQLRLGYGPFAYRTNMQGIPYDADGKLITAPAAVREFIMSTVPISDELRAEGMKKTMAAKEKAAEAQQSNANVVQKEIEQGK